MKDCYICGVELNESNKTSEHIIPNACGGRLQSKDIICVKCNSEQGSGNDKDLVSQLLFICNMLNVPRDRGEHQPVLSADKTLKMKPGGEPIYAKPIVSITKESENESIIRIIGKDKKIVKNMMRKLRSEGSIKLTDEEIDNFLDSVNFVSEKIKEPVRFELSVGGPNELKSAVKIATNFYAMKQFPLEHIKEAIDFIKNENPNKKIATPFYPKPHPFERTSDNDIVTHIIYLYGNKKDGILFCYIELLNTHCFLVKLSQDYTGEDISEFYEYDVLNSKDISNERTSFPKFVLSDYPQNMPFEYYRHQLITKFNSILQIAIRKQKWNLVFQRSLLKYPEGTLITKEMMDEFHKEFMKEFFNYDIDTKEIY